MKETFVPKRFQTRAVLMINRINGILDEYSKQGYRLSLRQLYYQLVARDIIPNTLKSYNNTGQLVSEARLAGLIDWEMIEDRGREVHYPSHWRNPADILDAAAQSFRIDHWKGQPVYVEVMVEKDALSGILIPVCHKYDVRFSANKGYSSSSAMYEASKRILYQVKRCDCESVHIIYLGDHDPSGIDMTRDIQDRFELFTGIDDGSLTVDRLALNYDQVEQWNPPENPAKTTDSRYAAYQSQYGKSSWELDAVEPKTLSELVSDHIIKLIDWDIWDEVDKKQGEMVGQLEQYAQDYRDDHPEEEDV